MTDEKYTNNGEPMPVSPTVPDADALLLYQAKQNVKEKKNLAKHALAYIAAWPVLGILYATLVENAIHPRWWNIAQDIANLDTTVNNIITEYYIMLENAVADAWVSSPSNLTWSIQRVTNEITWLLRRHYTPPIWYILMGVMLAWGGWVVVRCVKYSANPVSKRLRKGFTKKDKPDPVMQEYNRLKGMAEDENL